MAAGDLTATRSTLSNLPCNVFDGVDDYIEIPHNAAQLGANLSNGFTISAWIYRHDSGEGIATGSGSIFAKGSGDTGWNFQCRQDTGKMNFYLKGANKITETDAGTLKVWTHYLITITGANPGLMNMYKDGVLAAIANINAGQSVASITATTSAYIGAGALAVNSTNGAISRVKMWNRVLSATEIALDYADSPPKSGLIHYFKLNGDYNDYGSVGVAATNSGSYSIEKLPEQIKADIDKLNNTAATDNAFLQVLTNFERMDVVEVIKVVRA